MSILKNILLISLLTFPVLSFAKTTEITVWEDQHKSNSLKDAAKAFFDKTGIKVNFVELRYIYVQERLRLDGPAGHGPDLLLLPNDQLNEAVDQGMIDPIELTDEEKSKYLPQTIKAFTYKDELYAVPKSIETLALFYNKDSLYTPYETLDDYYNYSVAMRKLDRYGLVGSFANLYYGISVLEPYGAYLFGKDKNGDYDIDDLGFDNKGAIEGIKAFKRFYANNVLPSETAGLGGVQNSTDLFMKKKAAAFVGGTYDILLFKNAGLKFGVSALPILPNGKRMSSFLGVRGFAVSHWTENYEEAVAFAKFVNEKEYSVKRYQTSYEFPATKDALADPRVANDEYAKAFIEQEKYTYLMPSFTVMSKVWSIMEEALNKAYLTKGDTKKIMSNAMNKIRWETDSLNQR